MGIKLCGAQCAEVVANKSGRIIDQQADRRETVGRREDRLSAFEVAQIGNGLHCPSRNIVPLVMNVRDDGPAILDQRGCDDRANALARSSNDCRSRMTLHGRPVVIASAPKQ